MPLYRFDSGISKVKCHAMPCHAKHACLMSVDDDSIRFASRSRRGKTSTLFHERNASRLHAYLADAAATVARGPAPKAAVKCSRAFAPETTELSLLSERLKSICRLRPMFSLDTAEAGMGRGDQASRPRKASSMAFWTSLLFVDVSLEMHIPSWDF